MSTLWSRIADQSNGTITVDDLERAATRLNAYQVVYANDHNTRVAYELIVSNFNAYRSVFAPLGRDLVHRPTHGYVVCLARHRIGPRLHLPDTRLAVVLRRLYDDKMQRADIDQGRIVTDVHELQTAWQDYLKLPWKFKHTELEEHLKVLRRHGIVQWRTLGDESSPFEIVIRAAIEDVIGEAALHQLAAYGNPGTNTEDEHEAS